VSEAHAAKVVPWRATDWFPETIGCIASLFVIYESKGNKPMTMMRRRGYQYSSHPLPDVHFERDEERAPTQ
jgi:hypothetical protein